MAQEFDAAAIGAIQDDLAVGRTHRFVSSCRIVKENEEVGLLDPEPQQVEVLDAMAKYRWVMVVKYRQAKVSTVAALALLGHVEYTPGIQGVFVAERYETAETVWNRASYAYEHQAASVRIPLRAGTSTAKRELRFVHNGAVRVVTGGGKAPAIGNSPDRVVVTEYPDVPDHENFNQHFFPTVNKRPNARIVFEHTPGLGQTIPEIMWHKALDGKSRFHPVFLKWWLDPTCTAPLEVGFKLTNEEIRVMEELQGATPQHMKFMRLSLDTEFTGDVELFRHKYPFHPLDGWVFHTTPTIPRDALKALLARSLILPESDEVYYFEQPEEDAECQYLITADPAGFGATGDPSAFTVWNCWDRREAASWSGREDPGLFADRLLRVQKHFGVQRTLLAVESNKGECVAALVAKGAKNLYMNSDSHPGFYATEQVNAECLVALVSMLRAGELHIRARSTLMQLAQWDGKGRKRHSASAEGRHHFDRAVTCRIAAYLFRKFGFRSRPVRKDPERGMTVAEYSKYIKHMTEKPRKSLGIDPV